MTEPGELGRTVEINYIAQANDIMDATRETFDADSRDLAADLETFNDGDRIKGHHIAEIIDYQRSIAVAVSTKLKTNVYGDLLLPTVIEAQKDAIQVARIFAGLGNRVATELVPELSDEAPSTATIDALRAQGRDPFETMMRWHAAADILLVRASSIFQATVVQMKPGFNEKDQSLIVQDDEAGDGRPSDELPGVHQAAKILREPHRLIKSKLPNDAPEVFIDVYGEWQATQQFRQRNNFVPAALYTLNRRAAGRIEERLVEESTQQAAENEEMKVVVERLVAELSGLIDDHTKASAPLRTSWSQAQKAKLRDVNTGLLALARQGEIAVDPKDQTGASKRITGVLRALQQFGQHERQGRMTPEGIVEKLASHLTREREVAAQVLQAQAALEQANVQPDLSNWLPVGNDLDFIQAYWAQIQSVIGTKWSTEEGTKSQALADIDTARRHYIQAKKELDNPEQRLKYMARALGTVALPPEARPQNDSAVRERKRHSAQKALKEIVQNPAHPEDVRMRAEVIDHIMEVATSQRTPEDDPDFGDLFLSELAEGGARYFCVTFRDDAGKEWTLVESLTLETATYVIPMELARDYGTLGEFIQDFGKTAQRELGARQVVHAHGWTPQTHINRIYDKIRTAPSS